MKKFLKIISIFTAAAVLLGLMCLSIALFYPGATQNILMFSANKILQGMTVRDLVIKKQVYRLPRQFTFKDVSWTLTQGRETYVMSFGAVQVSQIMDIISSGKGGVLQLKDGMVKVSAFRLEGVDVRLVSKSMPEWAGRVSVKEAESNGFKVRDIDAQAVMTSQEAVLSGINGDSYRGKVMGSAHIYFVPMVHYAADVTFEGLDTTEMEDINPSLFSQVGGRIYGTASVRGPAGGIEDIHMDVRLNEDGEIQAKLLEPLLAYIPKSVQKETLKAAIKDNRRIRVNNARMKLTNKDSEIVSADIKIQSGHLNLDVNVIVDIIIEGGMQGLFKNFASFSQLMKGS